MEGINEVQGKRKRKRKRTRPPRGAARRARGPQSHSHPFEVRRKAVQLCLEERFPLQRVAREMGVGLSTLSKWVRAYREQGEAGLQSHPRGGGRRGPKVAAAVKTQVVEPPVVSDLLKYPLLLGDVSRVRRRDARLHVTLTLLVSPLAEANQFLGTRIRQGAENDGVHQAENGCVGADTERERQHRYSREPGILAHHAQSIAKVLQQYLHWLSPLGRA